MDKPKSKPLDTSSPRYWRQNAEHSIRDVYDALIEIITNADDRYVILKAKRGRIEIEVERRRKSNPSIIKVRDFADGMTSDDMEEKLARLGNRVSGMENGESVRGNYSRGAKDVAILGKVTFESIARDGQFHRCQITRQGRFRRDPPASNADEHYSKQLKILEGTGTVVTIEVDSARQAVPQHKKLLDHLGKIVALRDIIASPDREVVLYDVNKGRKDVVKAPVIQGKEHLKETFKIPRYPNATAKLIVKRAKKRFEDRKGRFRMGGILVKSKHAIHEATLFAPELENDPHAKWFYGKLTCEYIDDLANESDERYEKDLPPKKSNPSGIIDSGRKEGLHRDHPFVQALFGEALKRLRPLVEEERKQAESNQAKIESGETRKRLRALERAAAKFMSQNLDEDETARDADDTVGGSAFEKSGFSLVPVYTQIVVGQSVQFWLNIKQEAFPEFAVGDSVQISCETDEIRASKRFDTLEAHPNRKGVLRCVWSVKGITATKATALKVRVGSIVAESCVEVLDSEKEKYADVREFKFEKKTYTVRVGQKKGITLYAPFPSVVSQDTPVTVTSSDRAFKLEGSRILKARPELGIALCRLRLTARTPGCKATLTASIPGHDCDCKVSSIQQRGATIKIELKDDDFVNQRYMWKANVLQIGTRHSSLRRYLGSPPSFSGQEQKHFRVLLAEIVAEAVCANLISQNERTRPEEYGENTDWDAYYAEYTRVLTKFLPIAHKTQVDL
ncbi:MAG: ATP-binding protein [Planctomycetes bacterium]|nr:ATP-binding protein [Planctomycetota bacterium]